MKKEKTILTPKERFKKFLLVTSKVVTGIICFAGALVAMYALTPNRVRKINTKYGEDTITISHFEEFIEKVVDYPNTGLDGLHAEFEDFEITFKTDENSTSINDIKLDASIDFLMRNLNDIELSLIADVDYNGRQLPLVVGYMDNTVYFGLKDLRIKSSQTGTDEILDTVEQYVLASVEDGGLGINPIKKLEQTLDSFFDNLDIGALISKFTSGDTSFSFNSEETQLANTDWQFDLHLSLTKKEVVVPATETEPAVTEDKVTNIDIQIITTEDYDIKRVDLGTIDLGNVVVKGAINCEIAPLTIVKPDDPTHPKYNPNYNYVEIVNYKGWIKKLADLLADDNRKMSLSFDMDMTDVSGTSNIELGAIKGDIDLDFSKLIDLSSWRFEEDYTDEELEPQVNGLRRNTEEDEEEEETLLNKVLNGIKLGVNLELFGQNATEYANLNVKYVDNATYINFNEQEVNNTKKSVIKAKADTETMNWLVNEMPELLKGVMDDSMYQTTSSLFDFVTGSTLVTAIKSGDYSGILDVIETLRNDDEKIYLGLNLSSLGFGDDARVNLTLDSSLEEGHKVLDLAVSHLVVGKVELNLNLSSDDYDEVTVEDPDTFDNISFLPTVFEQVVGILEDKTVAFNLDGSLLDDNGLGLKLYGNANFDYGNKHGFGTLDIDQYKYDRNTIWCNHQITLDVDNRNEDKSLNNARFIYGSRGKDTNIKGKFTVQTILDIIDLVKEFIGDNKDDPRFSKFIEPVLELLGMGELKEIIDSKNYFRFAKNDILKEISQFDGGLGLKIVVGGELFKLSTDIELRINFNSLEDKTIKSLSVENLKIGEKTLNLELTITEYNENAVSPVDPNDRYLDFSDIKVLLQFGLNTSKLGYFKLTADVNLKWGAINIDVSIAFHVVVMDSYVKVYGVIEKVPNFSIIVQEHLLSCKLKSELTFETYPSGDPHKTNDIGGYFTIKKTADPLLGSNKYYYYRSTSDNFIVGDNLVYYLACGLLDIRSSYISDSIGTLGTSSSEQKPAGDYTNMFTDTGFVYDANACRWDIGINIGAVAGVDALDTLEISLYGGQVNGVGYFTKLDAQLGVQFSLIHLNVKAHIELKDIDPNVTDWSSSIQSAFNAVNGYNIPSSYLNQLKAYEK